MRKSLLVLIALVTSSAYLYADSTSTGTVYFTLPSTGVAQAGKSWATKNNDNWQAAATALSGQGPKNAAVAVDTTSLANRPFVLNLYDEGVRIADITTLNCVGAGVACTAVGSTGAATITATGGGGAVSNSTFVFQIAGGGGVYLATATPAIGTVYGVGRSTWHVIDARAYVGAASSVSATKFQVTLSTSFDFGGNWINGSQELVVSTGMRFSIWYSTFFDIQTSTNLFGVWMTTVPSSGLMPQDWGVQLRAWKDPEPWP